MPERSADRSTSGPTLTTTARLTPSPSSPNTATGPGGVSGPGSELQYRTLVAAPGEPHRERRELLDGPTAAPQPSVTANAGSTRISDGEVVAGGEGGVIGLDEGGKRLGGLIHFTDFQLADLASPSRLEFVQRWAQSPAMAEWKGLVPSYRPQEFLLPHAIEATVRSIAAVNSSLPGRYQAVLTTGDNADSAQRNELRWFLTYLSGGRIEPAAGSNDFQDAPVGLGDAAYWNPEPGSGDDYQRRGFPSQSGALAAAALPFDGQGLGMPWLSCFGNHDCLMQGRVPLPEGWDSVLAGPDKPVGIDPATAPAGDKLERYVEDPRWSATGPTHPISPDPERSMYTKAEYIRAHLDAPGLPAGHGFSEENAAAGTGYYAWDGIPGIRLICLDTTNMAGHVDGCVDPEQFAWLTERLAEVSSEYLDDAGTLVRVNVADERAVVLAAHHGLSTMVNGYGGTDVFLAEDVRELLHRFPNVVLWLSGHTHINHVTARPAPSTAEEAATWAPVLRGPGNTNRYDGRDTVFPAAHAQGAFWELSTGAISEWPVQFRLLDFWVDRMAGSAAVRIRSTMADSQVPAAPDGSNTLEDLAALHREVAANDVGSVGGLYAEGEEQDRNQDLLAPITAALAQALVQAVGHAEAGCPGAASA